MPTRMTTEAHLPQLMHANRLIIASNRGPVEYQLSQNKSLKARRGAGGMVTALVGAGNRMEVTWVAMTMTEGDRRAAKEAQANDGLLESPLRGQKMQLRYVAIPKAAYRKHYERISNEVLWFLQHYMYDANQMPMKKLQDAWENGYSVANQAIADAIIAEVEREESPAIVMLQDYHLYLASGMIRERHPSIVIQQFIHIPWPDTRCWYFLPKNMVQSIFKGLAGNDIIGFQTALDARNFLEGAQTFLEGEDVEVDFEDGTITWQDNQTKQIRVCQARSYPISISVEEERRAVNSVAGKRVAAKLQPLLGEYTIMRVDRIEPTKNIQRGFQAYDLLLEQHPELHGKVNFLSFLVPSRQSLPIYRRTTAEVLGLIEEINKKYGTDEWTPIHAFCENDRTRALAAMQYYDVLLVNPIIDGMNLVAKEGPAVNQRDGVLVLSRTAGAFHQLAKGSVPVFPYDVMETAQAIYRVFTMPPEERQLKSRVARLAVERQNLNKWLTDQINDINRLPLPGQAGSPTYPAHAETEPLPVLAPTLSLDRNTSGLVAPVL